MAGPRIRVEPANGSHRQLTDDMDVQNLCTRLRRYGRAPSADRVRDHDETMPTSRGGR